jgi:hypothetical protein
MDDKDRAAVEWGEQYMDELDMAEAPEFDDFKRLLALAKRALRMEVVGWAATAGGSPYLSTVSESKDEARERAKRMGMVHPLVHFIPLYAEAPDE